MVRILGASANAVMFEMRLWRQGIAIVFVEQIRKCKCGSFEGFAMELAGRSSSSGVLGPAGY